jgi:ammonia channel protein AmtB
MGFAGGFTGGYFVSRGDPFWTISGGLAGVIGVSAGADVYAPTVGYLLAMVTAVLAYKAGIWIETKMRVDDAVGAVAVHGVSGFLGILWVGIFAAGYPTGVNNVESSIGGQVMGLITFLPLGFLSGWVAAWVLKKLHVLRVPMSVEVEGLDLAEYETDFYPEFMPSPETVVEPDGMLVPAAPLIQQAVAELPQNGRVARTPEVV